MNIPYKKIHVIINPAAGHNEPILNTLNDVFHPAGVKWDVSITHESGDATRLARAAIAMGVDLVAGYGGDGTQMEVANGLFGSGVPQAILPGGTGNAMAHELKIPLELRHAAELIVSTSKRRTIDLARMGERIYMLRAYAGVSQQQAASREEKDKHGQLAYIGAGVKYLTKVSPKRYRLNVDGQIIEVNALIVYILNAGSIGGVLGISLPPAGKVSISDGLLDLYAVTRGVQPLKAITHHIFNLGESEAGIYHWSGKEIMVEANPPQDVWIDGEIAGQTPFKTVAMPGALEIVAPE